MMHRELARPVCMALAVCCLAGAAGAQAHQRSPMPTTQPGSTPPARRLTLEEAVEIALQNSKALRVAAEGVNRARGRVNEARSGFLPSLSAQATFTRLDEGSSFTIQQGGQTITIPIVKQDQKSVGISALLPIDILGQIRAATQLAQFQEIAARLDYNRTRNQVVLDVKSAYYDLLRARAATRVAEQALQNAKDRLATAEAYLRAETGTRFDVLRAQTEVANAEQNVITARNRVNLATATLNNVLNLDQNTPLETVELADAPAPALPDFNAAVEESYRTRPESLQADAQIRAAEKGVVLAQRTILPSLSLGWNFSYTPDQGGFAPKETSWVATATLTIPLFDQGLHQARTQQAKADVSAAKLNKQVTLDGLALEVRQSYLALVEAQERLSVASAALAQAEEQYRLAQVRFQAGVTLTPNTSPLLEISDAQTALTQAQNNQINAQYDLQNARARLERAMGRYAYDGAAKPGLPAPNIGGNR